jgi:hypothetical protein
MELFLTSPFRRRLGADTWKGIDAQEYVNRERESWD